MVVYRYADFTISSIWSLSELARVDADQAIDVACQLDLLAVAPVEPDAGDWLHHWADAASAPEISLARTNQGFLLRFKYLADFLITVDGHHSSAWPASAANCETLRHLLLDQVLPRMLAYQGRLVLHAGAVDVGGQAIAFVGDSGSGKSTLVASLHAAGYPLLSDDGLVLTRGEERVMAVPTYWSLRLWPDAVANLFPETPALAPMAHYSSKQRVLLPGTTGATDGPLPLAALYVLAPEVEGGSPAISLTRLSARDTCMAIISNAFQLDPGDHRRAAGLLASAGAIANCLPAFKLLIPRDFSALPSVRAALLDHHSFRVDGAVTHPGIG